MVKREVVFFFLVKGSEVGRLKNKNTAASFFFPAAAAVCGPDGGPTRALHLFPFPTVSAHVRRRVAAALQMRPTAAAFARCAPPPPPPPPPPEQRGFWENARLLTQPEIDGRKRVVGR